MHPHQGHAYRSTDAELMKRVRDDRDAEAFEILYARHSRLAMSCALRTLFDRNLAADAVQATFLDLWRTPANYSAERGAVSAWIATIACNRSIDILRRARTQERLEHAAHSTPQPREVDDTLVGAMAGHETERLRERLSELPEAQRKVIELSYFEELSHTEIAIRLSIPLGTVKSRTRLALERLRHQVAADSLTYT